MDENNVGNVEKVPNGGKNHFIRKLSKRLSRRRKKKALDTDIRNDGDKKVDATGKLRETIGGVSVNVIPVVIFISIIFVHNSNGKYAIYKVELLEICTRVYTV